MWLKKVEDPEHAEQGREQDDRKQEARLHGWDPPRKQVLIDPQKLHLSWIQGGGGNIYLSSPEQDKVPGTRKPKREQMNLPKQTQIQLPTRQVEVVEVENCAHDVAEEWRIQQ